MTDKPPKINTVKIQPFSIIKHAGVLQEAKTLDGHTVLRQEKVWIPEWGNFVSCILYDNHFVYLDPSTKAQRWFAACTCGGPAVIGGYGAYAYGTNTSEGAMLMCYIHAAFGEHSDGSK